MSVVGARGFEPPTFRSRIGRRSVAARPNRSQVSERIANSAGRAVQPSQLSTGVSKEFTTRLLPKIGPWAHPGVRLSPLRPRTWRRFTADAIRCCEWADVAESLGVCSATVYRLCESGELPHVRIVNSIRVRSEDLRAFLDRGAAGLDDPD